MTELIDYDTFIKFTAFNTALLKYAIDSKTPLTDILSSLKTVSSATCDKPLHNNIIMRKSFDLLPAAYLGLLAYTKPNGPDAIKILENGEIINYELKTSEINSNSLWRNTQGTVYRGSANNKDKRSSLKANFGATYAIHTRDLMNSKNIRTVLMCADSAGEDGYFDAWELPGEKVIDRLNVNMWGESRDPSEKKKIQISLNTFHNKGWRASTVIPLKGYDVWLAEISKNLPILKANEKFIRD